MLKKACAASGNVPEASVSVVVLVSNAAKLSRDQNARGFIGRPEDVKPKSVLQLCHPHV
jgi:hypothetical protein